MFPLALSLLLSASASPADASVPAAVSPAAVSPAAVSPAAVSPAAVPLAPVAPTGSTGTVSTAEFVPLASTPIYLQGRSSVAVPARSNGDIIVAGAGMGVVVDETQQVGMRFIYMHRPPANPLAEDTPAVPWAWGPVLDWQVTFQPESRAGLYVAASLGFVYGVPSDTSADNVILPILEGGVGLRLSHKLRTGTKLYMAPELGFVPGALAPYAALNVGMVLPGRPG